MLLRALVQNGARWLDRYDPTWHQNVDPTRLKDTDHECVLGQQYGSASDFLAVRYKIDPTLEDARWYHVPLYVAGAFFFYTHGFTPLRDPESVWARLWEDEIRQRQIGTAAGVEIPSTPPSVESLLDEDDFAVIRLGSEPVPASNQ